ncbi:MAG: PucR family transcriptional regulator ligand-binding domain-containing protein [Chloroflexi bacterium]|nr:PucR family transcriptional regulator ligand-binding domain-containing protein [Chloroflexota bacterium]
MGISVHEALSVSVLAQGKLLAGRRNLNNIIDQIDVIESPFQDNWDAKNCLFLTSFYASVNNLPEQIRTIEMLYEKGCSALCFQNLHFSELDLTVIQRAEELGLPLIQIPASVSYAKIITSINKIIKGEKINQLLPNQDAYQKLMKIIGQDGKLEDITKALTKYINYPVVIIDSSGHILSGIPPEGKIQDLENVMNYLSKSNEPITNTYWVAPYKLWLVPVFSEDKLVVDAFIIIDDPNRLLNETDVIYVEQAANIVAFNLIARQQERKSEHQLRKIFVENLLNGNFDSTEIILNQARLLGWNLSNKRVIILIDLTFLEQDDGHHFRICQKDQFIKEQLVQVVTQVMNEYRTDDIFIELDDHIVIMPGFKEGISKLEMQNRIETTIKLIKNQISKYIGEIDCPITVGGFHETVDGLCESYSEAMSSLKYFYRNNTLQNFVWYDDIEIFLILDNVYLQSKIQKWAAKILGKLIDYDLINETELVKTLEAYFDTNQKLQQTADKLFIHPKTLKYRLQRIEEILGKNPFLGENQLNYFLACKIIGLSQMDK